MLFNSQIFLLLFLPLTISGYYFMSDHRVQREWLLISAFLIFYGYWDYRLVPYHQYNLPALNTRSGAQWAECKSRIEKLTARHPNTIVLDFMIPSPITTRDENYWDVAHYTTDVADQLTHLIAKGANGELAPNGEYVVLKQIR